MKSTKKSTHESWFKDIPLTSLGWELAIPIFGGVFLGYKLDQNFNTFYTFTLILLVAGIVTGYYSLYKYIQLEIFRTKSAKNRSQKENRVS